MTKIAVVSLCNNYSREQDWFKLCVGTWNYCFAGVDKFFVSDGTLNSEQKAEIELLSGGKFIETSLDDKKITLILEKYPAISKQRDMCVFYKRIIDYSVYFSAYDYVLSIDTDVGIVSPIQLPDELPEFAFCVDDVPGYSASPSVAFQTKIVTGLNAGFLLFKPEKIELNFIEYVTKNYISQGKTSWWSEQTCWALIAGSLCDDVRVFSPNSVAIVSGLQKRSLDDIRHNKTRYFTKSNKIEDLQSIKQIIGDAKVIHFAGPGKPWINPIMSEILYKRSLNEISKPELLKFDPLPNFSLAEKIMLFIRLLIQKYK